MALEMRGACERCGAGLAPDAPAKICSYECTFCPDCATAARFLTPTARVIMAGQRCDACQTGSFHLGREDRLYAALAAASFSISTSAAVYRWVDADGHVHYTDKAVENAEPVKRWQSAQWHTPTKTGSASAL